MHKAEIIGNYDAAVVDSRDGELHDAARALDAGEAALIVVGEATLAKGFEKAVTGPAKTAERELNATADELAKDLTDAVSR